MRFTPSEISFSPILLFESSLISGSGSHWNLRMRDGDLNQFVEGRRIVNGEFAHGLPVQTDFGLRQPINKAGVRDASGATSGGNADNPHRAVDALLRPAISERELTRPDQRFERELHQLAAGTLIALNFLKQALSGAAASMAFTSSHGGNLHGKFDGV